MIFRVNYDSKTKVRPGPPRELAPVQKSQKNGPKAGPGGELDHGPIKFFVCLDPGLPIANLRYTKKLNLRIVKIFLYQNVALGQKPRMGVKPWSYTPLVMVILPKMVKYHFLLNSMPGFCY